MQKKSLERHYESKVEKTVGHVWNWWKTQNLGLCCDTWPGFGMRRTRTEILSAAKVICTFICHNHETHTKFGKLVFTLALRTVTDSEIVVMSELSNIRGADILWMRRSTVTKIEFVCLVNQTFLKVPGFSFWYLQSVSLCKWLQACACAWLACRKQHGAQRCNTFYKSTTN